jgi:hypothetical protein
VQHKLHTWKKSPESLGTSPTIAQVEFSESVKCSGKLRCENFKKIKPVQSLRQCLVIFKACEMLHKYITSLMTTETLLFGNVSNAVNSLI